MHGRHNTFLSLRLRDAIGILPRLIQKRKMEDWINKIVIRPIKNIDGQTGNPKS
jgi:hypothetical protein